MFCLYLNFLIYYISFSYMLITHSINTYLARFWGDKQNLVFSVKVRGKNVFQKGLISTKIEMCAYSLLAVKGGASMSGCGGGEYQ